MKRFRWILLAVVALELGLLAVQHYRAMHRAGPAPLSEVARELPAQELDAVSLEALSDRIADAAGVLGGFRKVLEWQIRSWRDDLGIEIHVVTLRDPTDPIETLADQVFQLRRIGQDAPSGGLLVLLNPARGEARIEVSYALEHVFPDAIIGRLAADQLAPFAAYRMSGMAAMDVLNFLKDTAYLKAIAGELPLAQGYRERPEFLAKARYLSGGAGARATLAAAAQMDRDFKAIVSGARRERYAPSADPRASAEAYLRTQREQVGDPTLDLYTPGTRCMLEAYPYAPFEQLERLERAETSKPLRVSVQGDHAVVDSDRPAHGFVPILLERRGGLWRVDLVETWKNLFFDEKGNYWHNNSNHPYAFALGRFGGGRHHGIAPWVLSSDLAAARRTLASRGRAFDEYLLGELLFRNCFVPVEAFAHYERAIELSPQNLRFHETLADRASYVGFHDLAVSAYAELGETGLMALARAQRAARDVEAAIASAREAVERDRYWIEALELLRELLLQHEDRRGAERVARRLAEIRSDPGRPDAPVTLAFDPPQPVLHGDTPTKVGDTMVYSHSFFSPTLTNSSAREVEIVGVTLTSDGTAGRSGLGDIVDYWTYPAGSHRLRAGESVRFDKTWGFTEPVDHQQLRYVFDVCWKGGGDRQCRDYRIDLFSSAVDVAGLADPEARAGATIPTAPIERAKRASPELAARLELLALLRSRRFDEVTRRVETVQAAFEADPSREPAAAQLWDTFATSDPTLGPVLDAWANAEDSYAPRAALGAYHRRCGWEARGERLASKTSREQFDAMHEHFQRARENLLRALEMHPRLVMAYTGLINMGRATSDGDELRRLVERSAAVCPSCLGPAFAYLEGLEPRWGGSHEEMERFLAELAPRIKEHPRLAVLAGAVAADRAYSARMRKDYPAALRLYDEALSHGDYWPYRRYRGQVLYRLERYDEALADHEFWLAHGARSAEALLWKTYTLAKRRRLGEAAEAIAIARRLDPGDREIERLASWYEEATGRF